MSAFRNLLHHHVHQTGAGPADTFWTGLGAVRRAAFLDIGGFDEARYPHPSVEDIDLGRRLSDAGQPILLDPTIQGTHLKAWTLAFDALDRLRAPGHSLGRARVSPAPAVVVVEPRLAPPPRARPRASSGSAAALLRRFGVALVALAVLVALNRSFYALLLRRQGLVRAFAGVGLHAMHHLVAVAAVPVGSRRPLSARSRPTRGRVDACPRRSRATRRRSSNDVASRSYRAGRLRAPRRARLHPCPRARRRARSSSRWPIPIRSAVTAPRASRPRRRAGCDVHRCDHVARAGRTRRRGAGHAGADATSPTRSAAATAGVAVLVEKPPALDAAGAAALAALTPPPWVGFNRRYDPGAQRVRAAIPAEGDVDLRLEISYRRRSWRAHSGRRRRAARPRAPPRRLGPLAHPERGDRGERRRGRSEPRRPHRVPRRAVGPPSSPPPIGSTTR